MIVLLIIADDFTGALDTSVQFASRGICARVSVGSEIDFAAHEVSVLVVDTETRHSSATEAYGVVADLTRRAKAAGVRYIYKKTDSALRGNVGAELAAVLSASGCRQLAFLPSFPQMGRITVGGILYIDGVPVSQSPFSIDPFAPVKHSVVTELIAEQCDLPAKSFPALKAGEEMPQDEGILVFDAENISDFHSTGRQMFRQKELLAMAGCAGFGAVLPELLGIPKKETRQPPPQLDPRLLVICGSVNPITLTQLDNAEKAGFARLRLTPNQKLQPDYWKSAQGRSDIACIEKMLATNTHCIIETNDLGGNQLTADYAAELGIGTEALRVRIAGGVGQLVSAIFASDSLGTLLLTGGDTLLQCMNSVGVKELEPICELENGVVLARFTYKGCTRHVITKSGGFGQETLLTDLSARIASQ